MSKLDANGRWGGKMLLTEHQEQYKDRHKKQQGRATSEELTMIRDAIMYPHMLTICDKSIQEVKHSTNLFRRYFEQCIQLIMDRINKDLYALRKEMRARNIKIFSDEITEGIIYHRYACRGYEDQFGIVRETLRAEISVRLAKYAADLFQPAKGEW